MSIEPFIYLTVFLFLSLLTFVVRWLGEKVREEIKLGEIFGPSKEFREQLDRGTPKATTTPQSRKEPISTLARSTSPRKRRASLKISLHNKRDLRQGIVLMTVLGPCRALEQQQDVIS